MTIVVPGEGGTVTVSDAALTQIVVRAAEAVDGAHVRRVRRRLALEIAGRKARVELALAVSYGRVLPEVAGAVQERVAAALGTMCGLDVTAVNVAVVELE